MEVPEGQGGRPRSPFAQLPEIDKPAGDNQPADTPRIERVSFTNETLSAGLKRFYEAGKPAPPNDQPKRKGRRARAMTTLDPRHTMSTPKLPKGTPATQSRGGIALGTTRAANLSSVRADGPPVRGRPRGHSRAVSAVPKDIVNSSSRLLNSPGLPTRPADRQTRRRLRASSVGPGMTRSRPAHLDRLSMHKSPLAQDPSSGLATGPGTLTSINEGADGEEMDMEEEEDEMSDISDDASSASGPRELALGVSPGDKGNEAVLEERKWYFDRKSKEQKQKLHTIKQRIAKLLFKYEYEGALNSTGGDPNDAQIIAEDQDYSSLSVEDQFFQMYVSKFKTESLFKNLSRIESSRTAVLTLMKKWMGEDHLHEVDLNPAVMSDDDEDQDTPSELSVPVTGRDHASSMPERVFRTTVSGGSGLRKDSTSNKSDDGGESLKSPKKSLKPNHTSLTRLVHEEFGVRSPKRKMKPNYSGLSDLSHISEDTGTSDDESETVQLSSASAGFDKLLTKFESRMKVSKTQLQSIMNATQSEFKSHIKDMNPTSAGHLLAKSHREMTELRNELKSQKLTNEELRIDLRDTNTKLKIANETLEEKETELKNAQHRFHLSAVRAVERQGELRKRAMELKQGAETQVEEQRKQLSDSQEEVARLKTQLKKFRELPLQRLGSTVNAQMVAQMHRRKSSTNLDGSTGSGSVASELAGNDDDIMIPGREEPLDVQKFSLTDNHVLEFPVDHDIPFLRRLYDNNRKVLNNYMAVRQMQQNQVTLDQEKAYLEASKEAQLKVKKLEQEMFSKISAANEEIAKVKKAAHAKQTALIHEGHSERQTMMSKMSLMQQEADALKNELKLLKEDPDLASFYELRQKKDKLEKNIEDKHKEYSEIAADLTMSSAEQRDALNKMQREIDERVEMAERLEGDILKAARTPAARELAEGILEQERLSKQNLTLMSRISALQNMQERVTSRNEELEGEVAQLKEQMERKTKAKRRATKTGSTALATTKAIKAFKGLLSKKGSTTSNASSTATTDKAESGDATKAEAEGDKTDKDAAEGGENKKEDDRFKLAPLPSDLQNQISAMRSGYVHGLASESSFGTDLTDTTPSPDRMHLRRVSGVSGVSDSGGAHLLGVAAPVRNALSANIIALTSCEVGIDAGQFIESTSVEERSASPITEEWALSATDVITPSYLQRTDATANNLVQKFALQSKEDKEREERQRAFDIQAELTELREMVAMQVKDLDLIRENKQLKKENEGLRKMHGRTNEELVSAKEELAKYARKLMDSGEDYGRLLREHSALQESVSDLRSQTSGGHGDDDHDPAVTDRPTTAPVPQQPATVSGDRDLSASMGDKDRSSSVSSATGPKIQVRPATSASMLGEDGGETVSRKPPLVPAVVHVPTVTPDTTSIEQPSPPRPRRKKVKMVDQKSQTGKLVSATQTTGVQTRKLPPPGMGKFVTESSKLAQQRANEIRKLNLNLGQTKELLANMYGEKRGLEEALNQSELAHELALLDAETVRTRLLNTQHRLLRSKERVKALTQERRRYQVESDEQKMPALIISTGSREVYVADTEPSEVGTKPAVATASVGAQTDRTGALDRNISVTFSGSELVESMLDTPDSPSDQAVSPALARKAGKPEGTRIDRTYRFTTKDPTYVETATQCTILKERSGHSRSSSSRHYQQEQQRPGTTGTMGAGGLMGARGARPTSHSGSAVWRRLTKGRNSGAQLVTAEDASPVLSRR